MLNKRKDWNKWPFLDSEEFNSGELKLSLTSFAEGDWKIWITTGKEESMATSNMVFLYAYGTKGSAGPLKLGSGKDGFFRAGTTDIIKVWIR